MAFFFYNRAACEQPSQDVSTFTDDTAKLVSDKWSEVCRDEIAENTLTS